MASQLTPVRASCYVCQSNQLCLHVQQADIYGFYIHQKRPYREITRMIMKFLMVHKQFTVEIQTSYFVFLNSKIISQVHHI